MEEENVAADSNPVRGVTIDPPFARDLDDAIWVKKTETGFVVQVSIADVSSQVVFGSETDTRAAAQGWTRYHANHNDPMLPRELADDALSLLPNKPRPVIVISVTLDTTGAVLGTEINSGTLISKAKLSYQDAEEAINDPRHHWHKMLLNCHVLAQVLLANRRARGAMAIYDLFHNWTTTEEGVLRKLLPYETHVGNIVVQEFMIMANEAVARFLLEHDVPVLFRNHTARSFCPDRSSLLSDLSAAIEHPEQFSVETLRQRVVCVMNRATYSPVLLGHYGLNLPAYLHFTSPIRRYADLVNHRILRAVLSGEPSPYTHEALVQLGERLSVIEREIHSEKSKSIAERDIRHTSRKGESIGLARLKPDEMHTVLKLACASGQLPAEFETEIPRRLSENLLLPRDIYYLLFGTGETNSEAWNSLKKQSFAWLVDNVDHAASVLTIGTQMTRFSLPVFRAAKSGPGHQPIFTANAVITIGEIRVQSGAVRSPIKKKAEQLAALVLIQKMLRRMGVEVDLPSPEPVIGGDACQELKETPQGNFKGQLLDLCAKRGWTQPVFNVNVVGASHTPTFEATVTLVLGKTNHTATSRPAAKKKDAEQFAAQALLVQLKGAVPVENKTVAPLPPVAVKGNYVNALQEFCVKAKLPMPDYQFKSDGPPHMLQITCTCTLDQAGKTLVRSGVSGNKTGAKQDAARLVYQEVIKR